MGDDTPKWYISMDQFLQLVNEVVRSADNSWIYSGKNIHDKAHPEDLMVSVSAAAEHIALTLTAIGKNIPVILESKKETIKVK